MYAEQYCDTYYASLIPKRPIYCWGANMEVATPELMESLYKRYGTSKYNQTYYQNKLVEAQNGCGLVSDCSGMIYPISQADNSAKGYYANCKEKGTIDSIDLSHSCLVFRGSSPDSISHIGYYNHSNGQVQEMANSEKNFQNKDFSPANWNYWGKPSFIDYSSAVASPVTSTYLYKGIDISTYQKNVDYKKLKDAGVQFAILKIITRNLNPDNQFETHYAGCSAYGINISVYNYLYTTTIEQAREAANAVLDTLNGRKHVVYMDVEDNCLKGLGSYLAEIINAYQEVIERAGLICGIYTGMSFYNNYLSPYKSQIKCENWHIARYYKGYTEMPFDENPNEAYKPSMLTTSWQYTSSGAVDGIKGNVDLDVMYALPKASSIVIPNPVPTIHLNPVIKNTVSTNGKNLNVRNKPSTSGKVVGKMTNGANVIIYGVDPAGEWARLSVKDEMWSSLDYISSTGRGIVTAEKSLYVRSSDSKNGEVWGIYKSGEIVKILHQSTNTGWYLTVGKSKDGALIGGWCSNNYIRTQ